MMACALRVIALAPLSCLILCDGLLKGLALLCPVLYVLLVMPLRYSFAEAMMQTPRYFSFDKAFSLNRYGAKIAAGLKHALCVVLWGIPMAALLGGVYYCYTSIDALTIFQSIDELGNSCAQLLGLSTANNFMLGLSAVGAGLGLGVVIWAWGVARLSANRFIWADAEKTDRIPRLAIRRRLKGRRIAQLGVALVNLALLVPFLCVVGCALKNTVSDVSTLLMMAITTGVLPKLDLVKAAAPVAAAFVGLYLPLLPLRRWMVAAFAARKAATKAEKKVSA